MGGLQIIHGIGLVIGCDVCIEGPAKLYQGVTLGGNNGKSRIFNGRRITQSHICRNVTIFTNAVVVGPIIIGENTTIGAGRYISKDVGVDHGDAKEL